MTRKQVVLLVYQSLLVARPDAATYQRRSMIVEACDLADLLIAATATKRKPASRFVPPSLPEVKVYCDEHAKGVDAVRFYLHYESIGWKVNGSPIKSWQNRAAVWAKDDRNKESTTTGISDGETAWKKVASAIPDGTSRAADFGQRSNAIIRQHLDGWSAICRRPESELKWIKRDFIRLYDQAEIDIGNDGRPFAGVFL